jgi:succinyl-CoA synthetase beta subunit
MKLYEYQGKTLFEKYGIRIPKGVVINSVEDVSDKLHDIKMPVMVKAQVLSGGRGKAGGVVSASGPKEFEEHVKRMLKSKLGDSKIDGLLIEEKVNFVEEYYISITLDSISRMPVIIFSASGGMDIEEIAVRNPEKISKTLIDPLMGLQGFHFKICSNIAV